MACVGLTGFETGDASEGAISGTASIQTSVVRTGTYALQCNPTTSGTGFYTLPLTASNNAYARIFFRYGTKPASNDEPLAQLTDSGGFLKFELRLNSAGKLVAYDGNVTLLNTGGTVLSSGIQYMIEFLCGTGGAGTAWGVKINGGAEISGTSSGLQATQNSNLLLGKPTNRNSQTVNFYYDDVLVSDSGYPGTGQCLAVLPASNGTYQNWTIGAGSGSHWQIVRGVPPAGDTSYLLSPNTTAAETEAVAQNVILSSSINCVKHVVTAKSAGASSNYQRRLRSNTTDTDSTAATVAGGSYVLTSSLYDTDPATSAAWTDSGINGCQVGALRSSGSQVRMTFTALMVDYVPKLTAGQDLLGNGGVLGANLLGNGTLVMGG